MQAGRQLVLGAEGEAPACFDGDGDNVELWPPGGRRVEACQRGQVITAELRVRVDDHLHSQRRVGRERVGDQLAEVGVVGQPELRLDMESEISSDWGMKRVGWSKLLVQQGQVQRWRVDQLRNPSTVA